jgi:hypothetical protein
MLPQPWCIVLDALQSCRPPTWSLQHLGMRVLEERSFPNLPYRRMYNKEVSQLLYLGRCPCLPSIKRGSSPFRVVYHFNGIQNCSQSSQSFNATVCGRRCSIGLRWQQHLRGMLPTGFVGGRFAQIDSTERVLSEPRRGPRFWELHLPDLAVESYFVHRPWGGRLKAYKVKTLHHQAFLTF